MKPIVDEYDDDLWDITDIAVGTILRDWYNESVRIVILRAPLSMNVYMGVPANHPLAGNDYSSLPVECHGGLTYAGFGDDTYLPKDFYWYGYDYCHSGDYCFYSLPDLTSLNKIDHRWTIAEIKKDSWSAIYELKMLVRLSENIYNKAKS